MLSRRTEHERFKTNLDTSASDDIAAALAVLANAAQKDLRAVQARLQAVGFEAVAYRPLHANQDIDPSVASDIGTAIEGRGIYHGAWQTRPNGVIVHAYSDTDLLKDASGRQMLSTWYAARYDLARRDDGRRYGDGLEAALCDALGKPSGTQGAYQDGDLVMGPQVLLNGRNVDGDKVRAQNTFDLLSGSKGKAFKNISKTLRDAREDTGRWSWSCSEGRDDTSNVRAVRLSDGVVGWDYGDLVRLGVLPFRFFREPHAVKPVKHLNLKSLAMESGMSRPNTITVEQAVEALTAAARRDFASVEYQLKAAGFGITGYEPIRATPDIDVSSASDIGAVIEGRGIYHGAWQPRPNGVIVHAYSDTDLLRDASGKQLLLTWYQTRDELARRNNGRLYGDGTEPALRQALAKPAGSQGAYQDGDLVMAPQLLLNGRDMNGKQVRAELNTAYVLRGSKGNAFNKISETLKSVGSV